MVYNILRSLKIRASIRFDRGMEATIARAKRTTNATKTLFAKARASVMRIADILFPGQRQIGALAVA